MLTRKEIVVVSVIAFAVLIYAGAVRVFRPECVGAYQLFHRVAAMRCIVVGHAGRDAR